MLGAVEMLQATAAVTKADLAAFTKLSRKQQITLWPMFTPEKRAAFLAIMKPSQKDFLPKITASTAAPTSASPMTPSAPSTAPNAGATSEASLPTVIATAAAAGIVGAAGTALWNTLFGKSEASPATPTAAAAATPPATPAAEAPAPAKAGPIVSTPNISTPATLPPTVQPTTQNPLAILAAAQQPTETTRPAQAEDTTPVTLPTVSVKKGSLTPVIVALGILAYILLLGHGDVKGK